MDNISPFLGAGGAGVLSVVLTIFLTWLKNKKDNGTVSSTPATELWNRMAEQLERQEEEIKSLKSELSQTKKDLELRAMRWLNREGELMREIDVLRQRIHTLESGT